MKKILLSIYAYYQISYTFCLDADKALGAPKPWQLGFQNMASAVGEAIVNYSKNLMFFLVIIGFFVGLLLIGILFVWGEHGKKYGKTQFGRLSGIWVNFWKRTANWNWPKRYINSWVPAKFRISRITALELVWTLIPPIVLFFLGFAANFACWSSIGLPNSSLVILTTRLSLTYFSKIGWENIISFW